MSMLNELHGGQVEVEWEMIVVSSVVKLCSRTRYSPKSVSYLSFWYSTSSRHDLKLALNPWLFPLLIVSAD